MAVERGATVNAARMAHGASNRARGLRLAVRRDVAVCPIGDKRATLAATRSRECEHLGGPRPGFRDGRPRVRTRARSSGGCLPRERHGGKALAAAVARVAIYDGSREQKSAWTGAALSTWTRTGAEASRLLRRNAGAVRLAGRAAEIEQEHATSACCSRLLSRTSSHLTGSARARRSFGKRSAAARSSR
jgi:hypothetical protein